MVSTKSVRKIPISKELENKLLLEIQMEEYVKELQEELQNICANNEWIEIKNKPYYLIPSDEILVVDPKRNKLSSTSFIILTDFAWSEMTENIARKWFYAKKRDNPMIDNDTIRYSDVWEQRYKCAYVCCGDSKIHLSIADATTNSWNISAVSSIKIPIYKLSISESSNLLFFLIKNNLDVFAKVETKNKFMICTSLFDLGLLHIIDNKIVFNINNAKNCVIIDNELKKVGLDFHPENIELKNILNSENYVCNSEMLSEICEYLLECDKRRAHMEVYPEHILQDPESGHWELWDDPSGKETMVNIPGIMMARNPVFDAMENKSGVVGIDFGTKSTVVTYRQSRADILPMRVGSGQFSRAVSNNDYENPTVMELRNVRNFMECYQQSEGRPNTKWEDLLISHEAAEQLKSEQSKGDTFATFFSELKQWASDKSRQVRLRDLNGNELNIPSYLSITEEEFDPIEIYAYYLGLFINNMPHKIFLRYKLSFPATVEKQVRDKILDSFTKGIKKSLPNPVLADDACMKIFKVEQGVSEPAAYAITALTSYGFDPEEDDKYYYGIFDFGGGTTDFDFGVWSMEENEPENYDYQISHFGQGGDPYLGGENLLEILAYHVFLNNYDKLLKDKVVFIRPVGEKIVAGKDYLICQDSQYAHFNQKRMMERLRGVWEANLEIREQFKNGIIELPLFTMEGESKGNYAIEVDLKELDYLIEERIDKGVSQFFDALKNCFGVNKNQKDIYNVEDINIFLAGNSSKSHVVYKIFKKYIDLFNEGLQEKEGVTKDWFKIYPPLGTALSEAILSETIDPDINEIITYMNTVNGVESSIEFEEETVEEISSEQAILETQEKEFDISKLNKPTGKTGVAYGLLNNRVRVVQNESEEIDFRYYIGQNRKNKFYCVIDKDNQQYHVWTKFCTASREEFDIWFTRSAAAPSQKLSIDQIGVYSEVGFNSNPSREKNVYIRLVSPTDIEYTVATEEEIKSSLCSENVIERISLQEKQ